MSPTAEPQDASVSGPPPEMDSDIEAIFMAEAQDLSGEQTSPRDAEVSKETILEPSQSFTGAVTESQPTPEDEFGPTSAELAAITSEGNVDLDLGFDEPRASQPAVEPEPAVPLIGRPRAWLHDLDNSRERRRSRLFMSGLMWAALRRVAIRLAIKVTWKPNTW